ncbi:MAG TPA: SulP family inorganic anion transporter [Vicinamibacterales bacterium]
MTGRSHAAPLEWFASHDRPWLRYDIVAGLTASAVVVPQAMAYGGIAGLPLAIGLYTALVPLVVYAFVGTSRVLSVTTTSTIAILTANALQEIAPRGTDDSLILATGTLACLVGIMLLAASVLRLGVVASFISEPVLAGFKAGVGLTIVVDQIPKLLGVHFTKGPFLQNIVSIAERLPHASVPTMSIGAAMLALQLGLQRFLPRVPASLMTVAAGITLSGLVGLNRFGVESVGQVMAGLPSFAIPPFALVEGLWPAAIGIALMSFVETAAAGKAFRASDEPPPVPNRELLAIGLSNLIGGFFHNLPSGGGTSQTAVNRKAGARTQTAGVVTAAVVVAVLLFLAPLVHLMPQATLAVIVIVPCAGMIKIPEFLAIWRARAMEFSWALTAVAGVLLLGTLRGILVAVILSLLALSLHGSRRPVFVLGRKPGTDIFRPRTKEHPEDEAFPGLLMVKTEGMIHFANAQRIGDLMWPLIAEHKPRVVVLDCSAIPDLEYTALKMLNEAEKKMQQSGISLWLAGLNPEPLQLIQKSELGRRLGRARMHFNIEQALRSFLSSAGDRS